jgi:hypothetical protein
MIPRRFRQQIAARLERAAHDTMFPAAAFARAFRNAKMEASNAIKRIAAVVDADDRPCLACGQPGGTHCYEECGDEDRYTYTQCELWKLKKAQRAADSSQEDRGAS